MDVDDASGCFECTGFLHACDEVIRTPTQNKDLLKYVYDAVHRYGVGLSEEHIFSYAVSQGFVVPWGCDLLLDTILLYKEILAIAGHISLWESESLKRRRLLWPIINKEEVMHDLAYYQRQHNLKELTSEDVSAVRAAHFFLNMPAFADLTQYAEEQSV